MHLVISILTALSMSQAYATAYDGPIDIVQAKMDRAEANYYNTMGSKCGDNLLCYFTAEEIQSALGITPAQALVRGLLDPDKDDQYADEEDEYIPTQVASRSKDDIPAARRKHSSGGGSGAGSQGALHALEGYHNGTGAPIWGTFIVNFKKCAEGCVPTDFNAFRPDLHTCHHFGRALDVGSITCAGVKNYPIKGEKFPGFVGCMRKYKMKTLFRDRGVADRTHGHYNHAHFSIGCTLADGERFW